MEEDNKIKLDKLIDKETKNLLKLLSNISEDKRKLATRLIERVAFMTITLQVLEDEIKDKGPICAFEQGRQKMMIENPAQKSYNTMINRYTAAYDKLIGLLPKEIAKEEDDGFENFVNARD
jgi:hypothetical protein